MTDLPATLEAELNQLGVVQTSPVAWPKPKPRATEAQGWKPSRPGEEPPF